MTAAGESIVIAANPNSGAASSRRKVAELREALISRGFHCEVLHSLEQVQHECLALHQAHRLRAIVSAGGDGTADALANLLPQDVPLMVFPLGTENLLAKHLGIVGDVGQACDIIKADCRQRLDVGSANGKLFLVMFSCGFDAEVVRQMHAIRRGHINRWSYTRPILFALWSYAFPQLSFNIDGEQLPIGGIASVAPELRSAAWLFVFNVPRYAAALDFCPQADPCDGLLDVCTFERSGVPSGLSYLTRLRLGTHHRMRGFQHVRGRQLSIAAPVGRQQQLLEVPFQLDGDPGGTLPVEIKVLPGRLTLLVPPKRQ